MPWGVRFWGSSDAVFWTKLTERLRGETSVDGPSQGGNATISPALEGSPSKDIESNGLDIVPTS